MEIQQIIIISKELREKGEIFLSRELLRGNPRHKKRLWKRATLSVVALLGNLEGVSFTSDS